MASLAWYFIHFVSKSTYYNYKTAAICGRINESHGNARLHSLQNHTVQMRAMLTINVDKSTDKTPNESYMIGNKRMGASKVLPFGIN